MRKQNYSNHIRYYWPHHFVFYPLTGLLFGTCLWWAFHDPENAMQWVVLALVVVFLILLSLMVRQHYALMNQNRIVRLEMRFRYYVITQQRFEPIEQRISKGQLFALRFASDEELPALVDRVVKENLEPDAIKRAIRNWLPDEMRV